MALRSERSLTDRGVIATFVVDRKSGRELRHYLATVAAQCSTPATPPRAAESPGTTRGADHRGAPVVIIVDDLQHVDSPASLADAFNALLGLPLHHW